MVSLPVSYPSPSLLPCIAHLPPAMERALTKSARRPAAKGRLADGVTLDAPYAVERAIEYLTTAEPAVEGAGGDNATLQVAMRIKDFGISRGTALEIMLDHFNERCSPPWSLDELERKVSNAYRYGQNSVGAGSPEADFTPVDLDQRTEDPASTDPAAPRGRLRMRSVAEMVPDFDRQELVQDLLDANAVSVLYGPSNSGKTFLALDMALHIALGRDWHGRRVRRGAVLYIASEGAEGIVRRTHAFCQHHSIDRREPSLQLLDGAVNLLDRQSRRELNSVLREFEQQTRGRPALTVIDTLARAMPGADENGAGDMGALIEAVDALRRGTRGHVMLVHHTGKDKSKGARGHSSLRAAVDTEIEITDGRTARVTKQRDKEFAPPIGFELQSVGIGYRADGSEVTSCVVLPRKMAATDEFAQKPLKPGTQAHRCFSVLQRLTASEGEWAEVPDIPTRAHIVSETSWRAACLEESIPDRTYRRARDDLKTDGWIGYDGDRVWVRGGEIDPAP